LFTQTTASMGSAGSPAPRGAAVRIVSALTLILSGCVLNNVALEVIVTCVPVAAAAPECRQCTTSHSRASHSRPRRPRSDKISWSDKKAGALLTFFQYALVAVMTARHAFTFGGKAAAPSSAPSSSSSAAAAGLFGVIRKPTQVPLHHYVQMAALFAVMSLLNNAAFAFNISQPMHMVFRSANLMVTYAFGRVFFNKRWAPAPRA
jgi:hypothetical protein